MDECKDLLVRLGASYCYHCKELNSKMDHFWVMNRDPISEIIHTKVCQHCVAENPKLYLRYLGP